MDRTRRSFLAGAAALGALPALPRAARAASQLVVPTYGGRWGEFWEKSLLPSLKADTGLEPTLDIGLGKDFVAKIRAGGASASYSVFMGNPNIAATLAAEGFFEPWDAAKLPNLPDMYPELVDAGAAGVRGIVSPIGLAYRTDLVKTPPKAWSDLWDNPEFKGRIGLYTIGNTAGVLMLRLAGQLYGSGPDDYDTGFAKMKALLPFTQATWSGAVATSLVRGDVVVAPVDWGEIVALAEKGAPVAVVPPAEGPLAFEQSFHLVGAGPAKDDAHTYLNHLVSAPSQQNMAAAFFTSPSNTKATVEGDLAEKLPIVGPRMAEIIRFEWESYVPIAAELADRWNREIA